MKNSIMRALMGVMIVGLGACAETPDRHLARVHRAHLEHGSAYAEGYRDGCASGYNLRGNQAYPYRKDALKTQQDFGYLRGWKAGQAHCFEEAGQAKASHLLPRVLTSEAEMEPEGAIQGRYGEHFRTEEEREIWESLKK